jgi:hypothetical protein
MSTNTEKPKQVLFRHSDAVRYCQAKKIDPNRLARELMHEWYMKAIKSENPDDDGLIILENIES